MAKLMDELVLNLEKPLVQFYLEDYIKNNTDIYNETNNRIKVNKKLNLMRELCTKPNWNLYNSSPVKVHTIKVAKKIINKLFVVPEVFPTPDGNIQFEFEYKDIYLEFELIKTNKKQYKVKYLRMKGKEIISEGVLNSRDYKTMNKIIFDTFFEE